MNNNITTTMDSHNDRNDGQTPLQRASRAGTATSHLHSKDSLQALIRKHLESAIQSQTAGQGTSEGLRNRPRQLQRLVEPASPTVSDISPAVATSSAPNWHANAAAPITRSTTGASSRPSPPSSRDEHQGYPFPVTSPIRSTPDYPLPLRLTKGQTQQIGAMPDIPEDAAQRRAIFRNSGVPPSARLPPPTSSLYQDSATSLDGLSSDSGGEASSTFVAKPYGDDELDAFSSKSRPSGETYNDDTYSDIIHEPDAVADERTHPPPVPDMHETPTIRDSIQTLVSEQVQIGTAVQYPNYKSKARPVLKDIRASDYLPPSATSSHYTSQDNSRYNSGNLPTLIIPERDARRSSPAPWATQEGEPLEKPSAISQRSVSPVDAGAASSLGREPSDTSMMRLGAAYRGTSPLVRAHSRFSSRFGGPPPDTDGRSQSRTSDKNERSVSRTSDKDGRSGSRASDKEGRSVSRTSEMSNPFKDQNTAATNTTSDLIAQSLRLAADVNKSTSSSGLVDLNEKLRSERAVNMHERPLLPQDHGALDPGPSMRNHVSPQYGDDEDEIDSQTSRRKCCHLPLRLSIVLILAVILVIALAIIIPVAVVVIPRQNRAAAPHPTGVVNCEVISPCQNNGVSVSNSTACSCECSNNWSGSDCSSMNSSSCILVGPSTSVQIPVGMSIPPLITLAETQFGISLDLSLLISLFSTSSLSCGAQNALVTFLQPSSRQLRAVPGLEDLEPARPARYEAPIPEFTHSRLLERQQTATVSGLIIAVSSTPPTPTFIPSPTSSGLTASVVSSTPSPIIVPSPLRSMKYASVIVLYIFQLTHALDPAEIAQTNLQAFFSNGGQQPLDSGPWSLGNDFTIDMNKQELYFNNSLISSCDESLSSLP